MKIHVAIAIGLIGGLLFGLTAAAIGTPELLALAQGVEPLGTAFVNLLKMVVVPLVGTTLFVGVAGMGDLRRLGRIGLLTLLFFAATTTLAILIGMGTMRLLLPLAGDVAMAPVPTEGTDAPALGGPVEFLLGLIPSNPFAAAVEGALLPMMVFTVLFAAAVGTLPNADRERLMAFANAATAALIRLVHWILWTAPIGVFALAAPVTARTGFSLLQSLGVFIAAVLVGLVVFMAAVYLPAVRVLGGMGPITFLKGCVGSQIIAFTTTSSAATLPAMLENATEDLKLSPSVASFVIPLGAAVGRAGSALYQGAGLIFLAWLYGVEIPIVGIGAAVLAVALVSITVAAVPSASVMTLAPALSAVGVPVAGLAVLLGVDRIPDMFRTVVNVTGTLAATVVMHRTNAPES